MFKLSRLLPSVALLLMAAVPAPAATLTVTNDTEFEIYYFSISTPQSGARMGIRAFLPGQTLTYENATGLTKLSFDIGNSKLFFNDMAKVSDKDMNYVLKNDTEYSGLPSLVPAGAVEGDEDEVVFPQALYYIPDEATAKEVCPAVLKWWQSAHPEINNVVWAEDWGTLKENVLSYCLFKLDDGQAKSAENTESIMGDVLNYHTEKILPFAELTTLTSKDEALAKGAEMRDDSCMVTVKFGEEEWFAELNFQEGPFADSPYPTLRMSTWKEENTIANTLATLKKMNYRPWFIQSSSGDSMDTEAMVRCWDDEMTPDQDSAENLVQACQQELADRDDPSAIEIIFVPADQWDKVSKGEAENVPAFNLRNATSRNAQLYYFPNYADVLRFITQN